MLFIAPRKMLFKKSGMVFGSSLEERRNRPKGPAETKRAKSLCVSRTRAQGLVLFPVHYYENVMTISCSMSAEFLGNRKTTQCKMCLKRSGEFKANRKCENNPLEPASDVISINSVFYITYKIEVKRHLKNLVRLQLKFCENFYLNYYKEYCINKIFKLIPMRKRVSMTAEEIKQRVWNKASNDRKARKVEPEFARAYMNKIADVKPLKYIPFLFSGSEIANTTVMDILTQTFDLSHASIACMFYIPDSNIFLGIGLETIYEKFEESQYHADFSLLIPKQLKLYRGALNQAIAFIKSESCKLTNERLHYSMKKLEEHVNYEKDMVDTVNLLIPKGYDVNKYNKLFLSYTAFLYILLHRLKLTKDFYKYGYVGLFKC